MTRKEQIEEQAMHWATTVYGKKPEECFVAGAEWADANPLLSHRYLDRLFIRAESKIKDLEHDHKIMKEALLSCTGYLAGMGHDTDFAKEALSKLKVK